MIEETNKLILDFAKRIIWKPKELPLLSAPAGKEFPPFIFNIDKFLRDKCNEGKLILPELRKEGNMSIGIYSDYGGEHQKNHYNTYTFLVCGFNHSYGLKSAMKDIRKKFKLGDTEISFKNFQFGPIQRALESYLNTVNFMVVGLLYTVVVSKDIESLFGVDKTNKFLLSEILENANLGKWKPKVAEKLLRIVHTIAYLTALLSKEGQRIFWMTDHDAIASNTVQHDFTIKIFQNILPLYTKNKYDLIKGAVPFVEKSIEYLDFLSLADITAGSIERYFSVKKSRMEKLVMVKTGAEKVLKWLGHDGVGLKKQTIIIEKNPTSKGEIIFADVKFIDLQPNKNAHIVKL